ncbi:MAG TPA: tol-pal system protein YbgF [Thermoanaerobaculia bacterium]|nr:tol-pal system protein YbgF [Thermoanaerobaculia bacterium]
MKAAALPLVLAGAMLAGGCVTTSDVQKLQSQITELQDQLAQVKRSAAAKEDVQNVNQRIAQQTQELLKSNAALVAKVDQIQERLNNAQGGVEQTNYRLDQLTQQLTQSQHDIEDLKAAAARAAAVPQPGAPQGAMPATMPGTVPATATAAPALQPPASQVEVTPPPASTEDPREVYQTAYRDYQRGNYDLAITGFRDFINRYPDSELSVNAQYWIGESLYSQKKYMDAIDQFDVVVQKYPRSEKAPAALLKKGYSYQAMNQRPQAIVQYQYVVHEYPNSHEASLAKERLRQLGVDIR